MGSPKGPEWRAVPNYAGLYEVSDHGEVRTVGRTIEKSNGVAEYRESRVLVQRRDKSGYPRVTLWLLGKMQTWKIHQLVLLAFVGPCPSGQQCRHLDHDKSNNALSNLAYGSQLDNSADCRAVGKRDPVINTSMRRRLTPEKVRLMRGARMLGHSFPKIAKAFGLDAHSTAMRVISGKTWKTAGEPSLFELSRAAEFMEGAV